MARANRKHDVEIDATEQAQEVQAHALEEALAKPENYVQDPVNIDDLFSLGLDESLDNGVKASFFGKLQSSCLYSAINRFAWDLNERGMKNPDEEKLAYNANYIARYATLMWHARNEMLHCNSESDKTPWSFADAFKSAVDNLTVIPKEITDEMLEFSGFISREEYELYAKVKASDSFIPVAERLETARDSVYNEIAGYRLVDVIGAFSAGEVVTLCNKIISDFRDGYKNDVSRTRIARFTREGDFAQIRFHRDFARKVEQYRNELMKSVQGTSRFADEF